MSSAESTELDFSEPPSPRIVTLRGVPVEVKSDPGNGLLGIHPTPDQWQEIQEHESGFRQRFRRTFRHE